MGLVEQTFLSVMGRREEGHSCPSRAGTSRAAVEGQTRMSVPPERFPRLPSSHRQTRDPRDRACPFSRGRLTDAAGRGLTNSRRTGDFGASVPSSRSDGSAAGEKPPPPPRPSSAAAVSKTRRRYSPGRSRTRISLPLIRAPSGARFTASITSRSILPAASRIRAANACGGQRLRRYLGPGRHGLLPIHGKLPVSGMSQPPCQCPILRFTPPDRPSRKNGHAPFHFGRTLSQGLLVAGGFGAYDGIFDTTEQ